MIRLIALRLDITELVDWALKTNNLPTYLSLAENISKVYRYCKCDTKKDKLVIVPTTCGNVLLCTLIAQKVESVQLPIG